MITKKDVIRAFAVLESILNDLDWRNVFNDDELHDINKSMGVIEQFIKQEVE